MKKVLIIIALLSLILVPTMGQAGFFSGGGGGSSSSVSGKVCKTITNPSDADNWFFDIAVARTITLVSAITKPAGTTVVVTLQDAGADGSGSTGIHSALTADSDKQTTAALTYAIHDGDVILLDIGTVSGAVTQVMVCYE